MSHVLEAVNAVRQRMTALSRVKALVCVGAASGFGLLLALLLRRYLGSSAWLLLLLAAAGAAAYVYRKKLWRKPGQSEAALALDRALQTKERVTSYVELLGADPGSLDAARRGFIEAQIQEPLAKVEAEKIVPFSLERPYREMAWSLGPSWIAAFIVLLMMRGAPAFRSPAAQKLESLIAAEASIPDPLKEQLQDLAEKIEDSGLSSIEVEEALQKAEQELLRNMKEGAEEKGPKFVQQDLGARATPPQAPTPTPPPADRRPPPTPTPEPETKKQEQQQDQEKQQEEKDKDQKKADSQSGQSQDSKQDSKGSNQKGDKGQSKNDQGQGQGQGQQEQKDQQQSGQGSGQGQNESKNGEKGDSKAGPTGDGGEKDQKDKDAKGAEGAKDASDRKEGGGEYGEQQSLAKVEAALQEIKEQAQKEKDGQGEKPKDGQQQGQGEKGQQPKDAQKNDQGQGKDGKPDESKRPDKGKERSGETLEKEGQDKAGAADAGQKGKDKESDKREAEERNKPTTTKNEASESALPDQSEKMRDIKEGDLGDPTDRLGSKKGYKDAFVQNEEEQFDPRFTEEKGSTVKHEGEAKFKTDLSELKAARPEPLKDKSDQPIPLEYQEMLKR